MAKVLVVRKPDATIHVVPMANKAALKAHNNKLPHTHKWTFDEMEESEASKLPFIDPNYVVATPAKVGELQDENATLKEKLAEMEAKLAANKAPVVAETAAAKIEKIKIAETAAAKIEKIKIAETAATVDEIVGEGEERKTVLDAAEARKATLATV